MEKQLILPEGTDPDKITIAPAVRIGDFLYLSGAAGLRAGEPPGDDIETHARRAMTDLGKVLEAAGSSWDKVFKVNCFLVYPKIHFGGWNKVWKEFFPKNPPARTTVGAEIGAAGALLEVELIATV